MRSEGRGGTNIGAVLLFALSLVACGSDEPPESTATNSSTAEALNASPILPNFVVYAQRSVSVGSHDSISGGDVGIRYATAPTFGPQLVVADHVAIDRSHNLLAPSVSLGAHSVVGDVQTNAITNNGALVGAQATFPGSLMPAIPLASPPSPPGSDLSVASHQVVTLTPGSYGALTIADHAVVTLSAGTFTFSSVSIAANSTVSGSSGGVSIQVGGSLAIDGSAVVSSAGNADQLSISVGGVDGSSSPALSIGSHTSISALIAAPRGTIAISDHVALTGAVVGFDVTIADHVNVQFQSGFPVATTSAGQQALGGEYIPAAVGSAVLLGPVPPTAALTFSIGLPVRDYPGLQAFVANVSNPSSSSYRQYLTVSQFANTYGAPASDYAAVQAFATSKGLSIVQTFEDNLFVRITGNVAAIESALYLGLNYYQRADGTIFYAPDREPSVDTTTPILRVSGLDDSAVIAASGGNWINPNGSTLYGGVAYRNAYLGSTSPCAALTGTNQTIALFGYDIFQGPDLTTYEGQAGLPNVSVEVATLLNFSEVSLPRVSTPNTRTEVQSDIEIAASMAPGASFVVMQVPFAMDVTDGYNSMLHAEATVIRANVFSSSWQPAIDDNSEPALFELASLGVSVFQSSGDNGAYLTGGVSTPPFSTVLAVSESAGTIVGGTNLSMNGLAASYQSETAWSGSGGGIMVDPSGLVRILLPEYQRTAIENADTLTGVSITYRNVPDVSAVATQHHIVNDNQNGSWQGTSASTPIWAGFAALVNQQGASHNLAPIGAMNPALYLAAAIDSTAFNDITADDPNGSTGYPAEPGYDLATGLGTPTCTLLQHLGGPFPGGGGSSGGAQIQVGVHANEGFAPDVCVTGTGFTPGASVYAEFYGIPNQGVPTIQGTATVAGDGTFGITDIRVASITDCSGDQLDGTVSVSITGGGVNVSEDVPAQAWCDNGSSGGSGIACP